MQAYQKCPRLCKTDNLFYCGFFVESESSSAKSKGMIFKLAMRLHF